MNKEVGLPGNLGLKILALVLAVVLWLFVTCERDTEMTLTAAIDFRNLAPGLTMKGRPPTGVEIRMAGPRILLWRVSKGRLVMPLDLTNVGEGTVTFSGIDRTLPIPTGVRITRVYPSNIEVTVVRSR